MSQKLKSQSKFDVVLSAYINLQSELWIYKAFLKEFNSAAASSYCAVEPSYHFQNIATKNISMLF